MELKRAAIVVHEIGTPALFFVASAFIILSLTYFYTSEAALLFAISLGITVGVVGLLKVVLHVPRPEQAYEEIDSFAFPSGHAAGSFFLAAYLSYFAFLFFSSPLAWTVSLAAFAVATVVGLSRTVLKVHTPLQVVVGALLGSVIPLMTLIYQNNISILIERFVS